MGVVMPWIGKRGCFGIGTAVEARSCDFVEGITVASGPFGSAEETTGESPELTWDGPQPYKTAAIVNKVNIHTIFIFQPPVRDFEGKVFDAFALMYKRLSTWKSSRPYEQNLFVYPAIFLHSLGKLRLFDQLYQ
jgi:hypothetical protein